jgi:hypothetical protein
MQRDAGASSEAGKPTAFCTAIFRQSREKRFTLSTGNCARNRRDPAKTLYTSGIEYFLHFRKTESIRKAKRAPRRKCINNDEDHAVWRRGDDERRDGSPLLTGQIGRIIWLDRIEVHVVASQTAPHQNGMVAIVIPRIRFSDRPLTITSP